MRCRDLHPQGDGPLGGSTHAHDHRPDSGEDMKGLLRTPGCVAEALWWGTMTDLAVLRERIVDHGRRDAHERLAHLLYELLVRYRMVGRSRDNAIDFPMTQNDLAD